MNVPFVDLKAQYASIKSEVGPAMNEVLEACSFIMGPQVGRFEEEFARYNGTRYCIGVESGTAALKVALEAIGVGPGDEVILPANTYIASAIAVSAVGATPVFVDHDDYYLIDANSIEASITPRTKAIIPVHLYGQIVPMQPILDIAKRHGLRLIEDAAQSHGARW
ncbi:MAG TPA: aminotransferase class V-fold PLP-dependent enzyme, partial [Candidatus Acidoferrum sp.]|nr:aminotransferase class V-fold PLP-dependent enzyme [Candidatus Acidoferrum sp.]